MTTPGPASAVDTTTRQQPAPPPPPPGAWNPFEVALPALLAAYVASLARIRANMNLFIIRQFHHSGRWRDTDADQFVSVVTPIVEGAQQAVSAITAAYLHRVIDEISRRPRRPVGVPAAEVTGSAVRHGVDPRVVYRRPYVTVWTDLAGGAPLEEAVRAGERRALSTVNTDLQLAKTHTAQKTFDRDERVVGWRRVPQGTYTCALCLIASTQRYHKSVLPPIHPNCDCGVEPIHGVRDPGHVIDEDFLSAVHAAIKRDLGEKYLARSGRAKDTRARELDYRDIILVHEHGELGPVLGVRGQKFSGPEDIPRFTHQKIQTEGAES